MTSTSKSYGRAPAAEEPGPSSADSQAQQQVQRNRNQGVAEGLTPLTVSDSVETCTCETYGYCYTCAPIRALLLREAVSA